MSKIHYGKFGPGRNADNAPFPKREVSVTLTGEQWVTLLARILRKDLSPKGERVYHAATTRLQKQLGDASEGQS